MLSLDELLSDPLSQVWDARRVVTALSRAAIRAPRLQIQRWFYFNGRS
jgi:hypothetical protein